MPGTFAILCPGQGAQSPDMFDLATTDSDGRTVLAQFSEVAGFDLIERARAGAPLFDNAFAQPAMVAAAVATWATLAPRLPPSALFAGHSVGEVSAWACSGAWRIPVAANIAITRARLMDVASPPDCGMLAVRGLTQDALRTEAPGLYLAIVNDSDQVVLAGNNTMLDAAEQRLAARGIWTRRLDVHVPSHTPLMNDAAAEFRKFIATLPSGSLAAPVLRGIDGSTCRRAQDSGDALARAMCEPIRWIDSMRTIAESGVRAVLELGPGRTLSKLCAEAHPFVAARSVADFRSIDGVVAWVTRNITG